jgi:hypothetical protein
MIKKIGFAIVCLACFGSYAQDGTVSPYSYFGIGELRSATTVENQMMGGIGVYADSIHVNLQNPAAYADLGVRFGETFGLTAYTAGISYKQVDLKSATAEESSSVTNLDYLALAFTLRENLGVGFGIMPLSSVGYNLESAIAGGDDGSNIVNRYSGTGGLNRVYVSVGWGITDNLKVGVTGNFNFGTLESERLQLVEGVQLATFDERESRINGVDLNYALNYTPRFKDKYRLHTSIRINTQANLTSSNTQRIGSVVADEESPALGTRLEDNEVDLEAVGLNETALKIPTTATLGLGFGEDNKWFFGGEYSVQDLGDYENRFLQFDNLQYQQASTVAFGGFYVPDYRSFKYYQRITYRAGLRMENTGMLVNNTEIDNFGITFGVGLPLSRSFSNLNLGFEFGKRGTTDADLIEEGYFKINVGLSLNDKWFQKGKVN